MKLRVRHVRRVENKWQTCYTYIYILRVFQQFYITEKIGNTHCPLKNASCTLKMRFIVRQVRRYLSSRGAFIKRNWNFIGAYRNRTASGLANNSRRTQIAGTPSIPEPFHSQSVVGRSFHSSKWSNISTYIRYKYTVYLSLIALYSMYWIG